VNDKREDQQELGLWLITLLVCLAIGIVVWIAL